MKPQALLIALALVAVLAALPLAESQAGGGPKADMGRWPCCDNCGACNRKLPPECFCRDTSPRGCHPLCKSCDKFTDADGATLFACKDHLTNFCKNRCTPAA